MAYASKYYDPVKAHEYYMKTRELKGYKDRYGGSRGNGTSAASGGYTGKTNSGNNSTKHSSGSTRKHNTKIQAQISDLRQQYNNMSTKDRKTNRDAIEDQIQSLREQIRGGSTSGFNQKGKEASAYIKKQIEQERNNVIKKANKAADKEMLDKVKKLQTEIKTAREKDQGFNFKEYDSRIRAMLGEAKKIKIRTKSRLTSEYTQKYKDEIDKLRGDKSMYTYYERREKRKRREAEMEAKRKRKKEERARKKAERARKKAERIAARTYKQSFKRKSS